MNILLVSAVITFAVGSVMMFSYSTRPERRRTLESPECPKSTEIFTVGACSKFMTHIFNCQQDGLTYYRDLINAINMQASYMGKKKLRELRRENGKTIDENDPIPSTVYALFDREQFVFPTCHIGIQYSIDLPSANMRVNATGLR